MTLRVAEVSVATLGLGANLGDRRTNLQRAVDLLFEEQVTAIASSRVWETDPLGGPPGQPPYLNAVIVAETSLAPTDLLAACHRVESALGRTREVRWGPRTIDIDVLLLGDLFLDEPELTVPHPRMLQRAFVVLPLLDVDPDPMLPDGSHLRDVARTNGEAHLAGPPLALP